MQDKSYLHIAIDLGTESVKIVGAYKDEKGKVKRCLLTDENGSQNQPFSSLALYLGPPHYKWLFGQDINKNNDYANIVRVKEMLYLLSSEAEDDRNYYENNNKFPIFIFPPNPSQPSIKNGMKPLVEENYTFDANTTPKKMVHEFFKVLFERCIKKQSAKILEENPHLSGIKYISVYPDPKTIKKEYIKELEGLIAYGAGIGQGSSLVTSISAPQAVAVGAYTENMIEATDFSNDNDKTLIFDIGEKDISVAKVDVKKSVTGKKGEISICVEGADGHEQALTIGGADIDSVIGEYITNETKRQDSDEDKNTVTQDYMSYRQQYRLQRFVKSAKKHLLHFEYAYVTVEKDVNYNIKLTKDEFEKIIFKREESVGKKIIDYIITELKRQGNENVRTILLVGGGAASYHLCDYVDEACKANDISNVSVSAIDNSKNDISEYFSAIGAAMLEPSGLALKVVSAYAYGSYRYQESRYPAMLTANTGHQVKLDDKVFTIWLNRGDSIKDKASTIESALKTEYKDYMFKLNRRLDTEEEKRGIGDHKYDCYVNPFVIGYRIPPDDRDFKILSAYEKNRLVEKVKKLDAEKLDEAFAKGLKLIGNKDAECIIVKFAVYNPTMKRIEYLEGLCGKELPHVIFFEQGIKIDSDGNVTLFYENCKEENRKTKAKIKDSSGNEHGYDEIIIDYDFELKSFKLETN
ncbi:MAG: hypothetical protein IJ400_06030 [Clostridia bacterium]|nr:hypothetical protein [Clostridia bacterium]